MKPRQVQDLIRSLGSAYERYVSKFRRVRGSEFISLSEAQMTKLVSLKLHRNRVLMEIARHTLDTPVFAALATLDAEDVLNWSSAQVSTWLSTQPPPSTLYASKFANHGVDGLLLFELDAKDLGIIGVKKMHQSRVLEMIANFAKSHFPMDVDDEKDAESAVSNGGSDKPKGVKRRGSMANIDLSQLNGGSGGGLGVGGGNNDAIIYTMGELLLELGQMFKGDKVQALTTTLKRQLAELQSNSEHELGGGAERGRSVEMGDIEIVEEQKTTLRKRRDSGVNGPASRVGAGGDARVDSSPTGVNADWIKTQMNRKGHARRGSLTHINTNVDGLNEEEEDEDISDIE